jgi:histidinol-phosphatase (PHP family)
MIVSTYHSHSKYSDGKNTLEEMVKSAIANGMKEIGFSDHAPMPIDCEWSVREENIQDYANEVLTLKEKYKDQITIYLGIEQDYYSIAPLDYEYILGSVHYVYKNGEYLPVDLSAKAMQDFVNKHYNGDVYSYCEDYFELVGDLYNKTKCQIIGHFDLVTKFNEQLPLIDINHPRYVRAYTRALEKLLKSPVIFEINTGAISRGYRKGPYPDDNMIDIIAKSGKPFAICSDTHSVDSVATNLEIEREKLEKKGYKYIKSLKEIL